MKFGKINKKEEKYNLEANDMIVLERRNGEQFPYLIVLRSGRYALVSLSTGRMLNHYMKTPFSLLNDFLTYTTKAEEGTEDNPITGYYIVKSDNVRIGVGDSFYEPI